MLRTHTFARLVTAAAIAIALTGCAVAQPGMMDTPPSAAPSAADSTFNDADAVFVASMAPRHRQAMHMALVMLAGDDTDVEIAALAQRIVDTQQLELVQMDACLDAWDVEPYDEDEMARGGMHHGGMMDDAELAALEAATGDAAARLFLELMIEHHEGAIAVADDELAAGQSTDVVALAEAIVDEQLAQVGEMEEMLAAS